MAFSTYFRIASQLLVFVFLARILGAEKFGLFSFWFSVAALVTIPINYGFGIQLLREAAKVPEELIVLLSKMFSAKIALSLVVIISSIFCTPFITELKLFWLLLFMSIAESYIDFLNFSLRCQGHYSHESKLAFITSVLQLPLLVVTAFISKDVTIVAIAYLVSRIFVLFLTIKIVRQYFPFNISGIALLPNSVMNTLRSGFPYAADMGVTTLNGLIDIIFLKQMSNAHTVGIYQAGLRLMMGGTTPATIVSNVYLPRVSAMDCHSTNYDQAIRKLNLMMVSVGGTISIIFAIFSNSITSVLFGHGYSDLVKLLPWFALVLVLRYVAASFGINLTASGHQSVRVVANLLYLIVFSITALFLIPKYKATGLLISNVCSILVLTATYFLYVYTKKLPSGLSLVNMSYFAITITIILYVISGGLT